MPRKKKTTTEPIVETKEVSTEVKKEETKPVAKEPKRTAIGY